MSSDTRRDLVHTARRNRLFRHIRAVVRYESIRILLAIAAEQNYEIAQFDVKTRFLYGILDET